MPYGGSSMMQNDRSLNESKNISLGEEFSIDV
jgi:hypothetical protein